MSGKSMREFVDELGSKSEKRRRRAARFLREALLDERKKDAAMAALINAFKIKKDVVYRDALSVLEDASRNGADIFAAVPVLAQFLGSYGDSAVAAARALASACISEKSRDAALAGLISSIENGDYTSRNNATWALWYAANRGVDVSAAVPALAQHVGRDTRFVMFCTDILKAEARNGKNAVLSAFINEIRDEDGGIRFDVLRLLETGIEVDRRNLKLLSNIARNAKKEGKSCSGFALLYSRLLKELEAKAGNIVLDKEFHVPEAKKPDGVDRILKVRRLA